MIKLSNISLTYTFGKDSLNVLDNINISFPDKGFFCLMGKSGSGKTSFIYVLSGIRSATQGDIFFDNKLYKTSEIIKYRFDNIGISFQYPLLIDYLTARENILVSLTDITKEKLQELEKLATRLNILSILDQKPHSLSGGQKQRVSIIRSVISNPKILILDEPTSFLDHENSEEVINFCKEYSKNNLVLIVTHDKDVIKQADKVYYLNFGKLSLGSDD